MTEYYQEENPTEELLNGYDASLNPISVELRPDYSLDEAERELSSKIWAAWYSTPNGKEFYDRWLSPKNVKCLVDAISTISPYLNVEQLEHAYVTLRENNAFETPPPPPLSEAEQKRVNQEAWERENLAWFQKATTRQISERARTDRLFQTWLQKHQGEVVYTDANTLPPPQILGVAEPTYHHPDQLAWQRKEERIQRKKDQTYLAIEQDEPGLHGFAEEVKKMPSQEYKRRLADPRFKQRVKKAAAANLL